ncbi:MAG: ABC transporter ATP-binding protein [Eubacteriales bacterium]
MLKINGLEFGYKVDKKILKDITFDVFNGECIAVLGNNGAGKSTMLKCINKIISPHKGIVMVNGLSILDKSPLEIAKSTAYVAQKNEGTGITAYDAILLGRKPFIKFSPNKEDYEIVENIIHDLNLESISMYYIDELSGGELQKVMIARALAQQPKVLLLDEPTSSLDMKNQLEVLRLIKEVSQKKQIAVVIVIHDLNLALRYCNQFLFLKDRNVYCYGGLEVMTPENIRAVYQVPVVVEKYENQRIVIPISN